MYQGDRKKEEMLDTESVRAVSCNSWSLAATQSAVIRRDREGKVLANSERQGQSLNKRERDIDKEREIERERNIDKEREREG